MIIFIIIIKNPDNRERSIMVRKRKPRFPANTWTKEPSSLPHVTSGNNLGWIFRHIFTEGGPIKHNLHLVYLHKQIHRRYHSKYKHERTSCLIEN